MTHHKGFTLIELMVTLAVMAILASIAIPSYHRYAIKNAESQAQAKMKQLEMELNSWRATALTYKGFRPKKLANNGTVTYDYDATNNTIYVPANSTATNYNYMIKLVDGDNTANSLITTATSINATTLATGRAWVMFATPNPSKFNEAHKILLTSSGTQCKTKNSDETVTIASTNCGSYSEKW